MKDLKGYLQGGDLRSIADVDQLIPLIETQKDFDQLFAYLNSEDRLIVMRAAHAIEKLTKAHPEYLDAHKSRLMALLNTAQDKELKWHVALIASRIDLSRNEVEQVWNKLEAWVRDRLESKIVRVNSVQALYDLSRKHSERIMDFELTAQEVKTEGIPSINARIRKLLSA